MIKKKINIVVLMGGKTSEHEVSLISGREVARSLDPKKYNVIPVVISRNGATWRLTSVKSLLGSGDILKLRSSNKELAVYGAKEIQGIEGVSTIKPDVVFIAMHGPFGEDGTVQGMLELAGLKYTGSGVLASALGMDKLVFRKIMAYEGIPIPKYITANKTEKEKDVLRKIQDELGKPPYFVKPHNQGSSVGISRANNAIELKKSLNIAFGCSDTALVDRAVFGMELTCGILGNEEPIALPVIEIVPNKGKFFNYESKYLDSGSEEIVPARIPEKISQVVQELALRVFKAVGCRGFARVDFILKDGKKPVVLEINTIPGLTPMSLLPKAAKAAGIEYPNLIDKIIDYARK
jgi:D-alanine-D-alanine ligase